MTPIPASLPDYVERGGRQVYRPPYRADAAELVGLVLTADPARIDALLQRDLVLPSGGVLDYRCAHPHVIVTLASIGRMGSADPPDALRGHIPELELSFWCLVVDRTAKERLVWHLPYVFTDSGQTVATGREVYGYPKQIGSFDADFGAVLTGGGSTTVTALTLHPFGPGQAATPRPVLSLTRTPGLGTPPPQGTTRLEELAAWFPGGPKADLNLPSGKGAPASATITIGGAPPPMAKGIPPWVKPTIASMEGTPLTDDPDELAAAMAKNPVLVFLKQFRDVCCPTKACYQAVVEAPIAFDPIGATFAALDPALFSVVVESWDSHPIGAELGITPGQPVVPTRAFHATLGFGIRTGVEVWRAPT